MNCWVAGCEVTMYKSYDFSLHWFWALSTTEMRKSSSTGIQCLVHDIGVRCSLDDKDERQSEMLRAWAWSFH